MMIFSNVGTIIWLALLLRNLASCSSKISMSTPLQPGRIQSSELSKSDTVKQSFRQKLSLIASFNYGGPIFPLGPICTESIRLALDTIKSSPNFLANYELEVEPLDDMCARQVAVSKFVNLMRGNDEAPNRFPITIGGYCTGNANTGEILQHFDFVGWTEGSMVPETYSQRSRYKSYFPMKPAPKVIYYALANFLEKMNWLKIAILSENSGFFNSLESLFVSEMEKINGSKILTVSRFPYFSGSLPESKQVAEAVAEVKAVDARIIVIDTSTIGIVACWLHRYKLYGPNYALFMFTAFSIDTNDPFRPRDWCTPQMLREVLESVFYFGDSNLMNVYGRSGARDSAGMTGEAFDTALMERIERPDSSPLWWYWRGYCYNSVIGAAFILNATEELLQKRNETLGDWVTNGTKFQSNGSEIVRIMTEALYTTRFRTLHGNVEFDRRTTLNSQDCVPIAIFQVQLDNSTSKPFIAPVATYEPKEKVKIRFTSFALTWRTPDGVPPSDSVRIIQVEGFFIWKDARIALLAISTILLAFASLAFPGHHLIFHNSPTIRESLSQFNGFILAGDCILQVFTFSFLSSASALDMGRRCMLGYASLSLGYTFIFCGMTLKLSVAKRKVSFFEHLMFRRAINSEDLRSDTEIFAKKAIKQSVITGVICVLACCTLLAIWFSLEPIETIKMIGQIQISEEDNSIGTQLYSYECKASDSGIVTVAIAAIIVLGNVIMAIGACILAYSLRSKQIPGINDTKQIGKCLYSTVILLAGGTLISGGIFRDDGAKMFLSTWATISACTVLNMALIFVPKILWRAQIDALPPVIINMQVRTVGGFPPFRTIIGPPVFTRAVQ